MERAKLVRDYIPEIIQETGRRPIFHSAEDQEYTAMLRDKLKEEVAEFLESEDPSELADILEVTYALAREKNVSAEQLDELRKKKAEQNGGFEKKIILDSIEQSH